MPMSPDEFAKFMQQDFEKLREVVKISGARVE
jgi:hypothetical protein